jgi:hypothetical protein
MSLQASTGLRNAMLSGVGLKDALDGGKILVYAGTKPASADAAIGAAVLLVTITIGGVGTGINFDTAAAGGAINKAPLETWKGTNVADGAAVFYRHVAAGDDGTLSASAMRLQGNVGSSGSDLNLTAGTGLTTGIETPVDSYSVELPAGG